MSDRRNGTGEALWWIANVLLSALAVAIAYYDGFGLSFFVYLFGFFILMALRPT